MLKILITGSSGYLGTALTREVFRCGHEVVKPTNWRLGEDLVIDPSVDFLIHAAWDLKTENEFSSKIINEDGSNKIFENAQASNVKIIFISTMSSFENCKSVYGKSKFEVEKNVLKRGGIVFRPGLIWSKDNLTGILLKISNLINFLPLIPYPKSIDSNLYLVNREELCIEITKFLTQKDDKKDQIYSVAHPRPYPLSAIIKKISVEKNRKIILLGFHFKVVDLILNVFEKIGLKLFKRDSLEGLIYCISNPDITIKSKIDFFD